MTKMPFRYGRILDSFVVTNESGQFYFLDQSLFRQFISDPDALPLSTKQDLESKFLGQSLFLWDWPKLSKYRESRTSEDLKMIA